MAHNLQLLEVEIEGISSPNGGKMGNDIPPTQPQPYAMARVKSSFFHRGQLYGSFGDSDGCGTKTISPDGSCLSKFVSTPAETSKSTRPRVLRGDVPGTCSRCLSWSIPRGILLEVSRIGAEFKGLTGSERFVMRNVVECCSGPGSLD